MEERKSGQVKPKPTRPKAKQDPFCKGLSKEDIAIKERLDKLKEDRKKASEHKPAKNEGEAPTNKNGETFPWSCSGKLSVLPMLPFGSHMAHHVPSSVLFHMLD